MSFIGGSIQVRGSEGQVYAGEVYIFHRITEPCRITEVVASLGSQSAGTSVYFDVRKNGTAVTDSIFLGDGPIEITTSQSAVNNHFESSGVLDPARVVCAKGDELWIVISQVGSTYSGSDSLVQIRTS